MEKRIPDFLEKKIREEYNENEVELILSGLKADRKTTFRVNRIKATVQEIEKTLRENQISYSKLDGIEDGFIVEKEDEDKIRKMNIYQEGKIYLQSLSSMIPVFVLEPKEKENILDMCAAPRGKDITNCKCYRK